MTNALYHQEWNLHYHKEKAVSLSIFFSLTYWKLSHSIFHDGFCLPCFPFLVLILFLIARVHWLIEVFCGCVFPWNSLSIALNYDIMSLSLKILEEEIWINHGQELFFTMADWDITMIYCVWQKNLYAKLPLKS